MESPLTKNERGNIKFINLSYTFYATINKVIFLICRALNYILDWRMSDCNALSDVEEELD